MIGWALGWFTHQHWQELSDATTAGNRVSVTRPSADGTDGTTPVSNTGDMPRTGWNADAMLAQRHYPAIVQDYLAHLSAGEEEKASRLRNLILQHVRELQQRGQGHDASRLLTHYIEYEYRDVEALTLLSELYATRKDYLNAIRTLYDARAHVYRPEDLTRLDTRIHGLVSEYAGVLSTYEDKRPLLDLYRQVTQLEPDYSPYFVSLARIQLELDNMEAARQSLNLVAYDPMVGEEARNLLSRLDGKAYSDNGEATVIPLIPAGDHYLVDAWIDGQARVRLMIDTGASLTVIKPSSLLNAGVTYRETDHDSRFITVNGAVQAPVLQLNELTLGNQSVRPIKVGGIEMTTAPGVDGLLGMNYLKHFRFFIDQTENVLRLSETE